LGELKHKYREQARFAREFLDKTSPDVIVFNGTNVHDWILMQAFAGVRIPKIVIMHSAFAERLRYVDTPQQRLQAELETQIIEQCSRFVFVSPLVRDLFAFRYDFIPDVHAVIPNGIPDLFFSEMVHVKDLVDVGFVGRDDPVKNLEFLKHVSAHSSMNPYSIQVLTDFAHNSVLIPEFIANGVRMLPPTTDDASMRLVYRSTRLIISPSHFETLGLVPFEAIACGTVALVSKNMGVAYYFRQLGLKHLVTDFSKINDAIHYIQHLLSLHLYIPDSVRETLKNKFAWSVTARRFMDFFKYGKTEEPDFEEAIAQPLQPLELPVQS